MLNIRPIQSICRLLKRITILIFSKSFLCEVYFYVVDTNIHTNYFIIPLIILISEDVPEAVPLLASTGSDPTISNTEVRSCSNDTDGPIIKEFLNSF